MLKARWRRAILPIGFGLARTGLSPNALTLLGLLLNVGAGAVLATGAYQIGAIAFLVSSAFDALDGAVARAAGKATRFGAFLDSVADRYAESAVLTGLAWSLLRTGELVLLAPTVATLIGSLMVSYARARAEGLGVDCEIGLLQRTERILVLSVALLFADPLLGPALWLLAAATHVTVAQRVLHVRRLLAAEAAER